MGLLKASTRVNRVLLILSQRLDVPDDFTQVTGSHDLGYANFHLEPLQACLPIPVSQTIALHAQCVKSNRTEGNGISGADRHELPLVVHKLPPPSCALLTTIAAGIRCPRASITRPVMNCMESQRATGAWVCAATCPTSVKQMPCKTPLPQL